MFLIVGVRPDEKKLDFQQPIICDRCGQHGRIEVQQTSMAFSLFFIPIIRWNKRYFVKTTCCHGGSEIDPDLGNRIANGQITKIDRSQLHFLQETDKFRNCQSCGYTTEQDFQFCPKCGTRL